MPTAPTALATVIVIDDDPGMKRVLFVALYDPWAFKRKCWLRWMNFVSSGCRQFHPASSSTFDCLDKAGSSSNENSLRATSSFRSFSSPAMATFPCRSGQGR